MAAKLQFVGLAELKAELKALPQTLADEADAEIREAADDARGAIEAAYSRHRVTGNLARGVKVRKVASKPFATAYKVTSTAPHATWFEKGTEVRHYVTTRGNKVSTNKMWGKTPPANIFGPIIARRRRWMQNALFTFLTKHGLVATGTPE